MNIFQRWPPPPPSTTRDAPAPRPCGTSSTSPGTISSPPTKSSSAPPWARSGPNPSPPFRLSCAAATSPPASPDSSAPAAATSTCSPSPAKPATCAPPATSAEPSSPPAGSPTTSACPFPTVSSSSLFQPLPRLRPPRSPDRRTPTPHPEAATRKTPGSGHPNSPHPATRKNHRARHAPALARPHPSRLGRRPPPMPALPRRSPPSGDPHPARSLKNHSPNPILPPTPPLPPPRPLSTPPCPWPTPLLQRRPAKANSDAVFRGEVACAGRVFREVITHFQRSFIAACGG